MQFLPTIANVVWGLASLGAWRRYRDALNDPATAQEQLLQRYLRDNANTVAGRMYGFPSIRTIEEYQSRVPISTFDSIAPLVGRISRGDENVLTSQPVHRLVPSSGSTAAVKLIPYTTTLQREFSEAVDAWIADLYLHAPTLAAGPAYWCITPAASSERPFVNERSRVPVGFDDDGAYLGGVRGTLARAAMAVPATIRLSRNLESFRRLTLVHLLCARVLRVISVWHPSYLSMLFDALIQDWPTLVDDVAARDAARGRQLSRIEPNHISAIWPTLRLISCWGDGPARPHAAELAARTCGITMQPKGLLATEGVVTFPFGGHCPVAIRSHFFEFLTVDGRAALVHQLERGVEYTVVLTTGGGLYRYHLADRVIVNGAVGRTPSLEFIGKDDRVSDRFGEKLSDGFVARVLDTLFATFHPRPRFAMLAPEHLPSGVSYTLFVESGPTECGHGERNPPEGGLHDGELASRLEAGLRRNPHYAWCVDIGQLRPSRIVRVGAGADRAYVDFCVAQGQKLGDIKPVSLHPGTGWAGVLPC